MPTDTEQLVIQLEARIRDFEKNMAKANATANKNWTAIEQRGQRASRKIQADAAAATAGVNASFARMGTALKGTVAGLGAGIAAGGVLGIFSKLRTSITEIAQTGADARRAGLGAETFQELTYAALQAQVKVDALTDGMKELQLRADEFIQTGKGPAAEAFARIGFTQAELKTRLKDPADLLNEIINRVQRLDTAARIRIFDELFGGTGGEQFVRFIDQGVDGINRMRQEARETGNVLGNDVVKQAEEINKRFDILANTIGVKVKGSILQIIKGMERFIAMLPGGSVPLEDIGKRSLEITREIVEWEKELADARNTATMTGLDVDRKRVALIEQRIAALKTEDEMLRRRGEAEAERRMAPLPPAPTPAPLPPSSTSSSTSNALKGYDALRAAAMARINDLTAEQAAIGQTTAAAEKMRFEQDLLNQAMRRNITLSPEQRAQITALAERYGALAAAVEQATERQEDIKNTLRQVGSEMSNAFADAIVDGKNLNDVLQSLIKSLARMAINKFGMAFFGSLFGFDEGGYTGDGPRNKVAGAVHGQEFVMNAAATRKHRALLEMLNSGRAPMLGPAMPSGGAGVARGAPTINYAPQGNVSVEGGSRGPQADSELAAKIGKEVEGSLKSLVTEQIRTQLRPGGLLRQGIR